MKLSWLSGLKTKGQTGREQALPYLFDKPFLAFGLPRRISWQRRGSSPPTLEEARALLQF